MAWKIEDGRLVGHPADILRHFIVGMAESLRFPGRAQAISSEIPARPLASVVVDRLPLDDQFHYLVPSELQNEISIGSIVRVPLGRRRVRGWITGFPESAELSAEQLRSIETVLGEVPVFDEADLAAARMIATYYMGSLWQILRHFQPPALPKRYLSAKENPDLDDFTEARLQSKQIEFDTVPNVELWEHAPTHWPGEDVADAIAECVSDGLGAIVVDPGTASRTVSILRERGVNAVNVAGNLGARVRQDIWERAAAGECVVVGGRSCVYQHVPNLGLIVVMDESNPALKEQAVPCYHAREVAIFRAVPTGASVLITTASPSAEARAWAVNVRRPSRDELRRGWPTVEFLYRHEEPPTSGVLGEGTVLRIRKALRDKARVLLFLNRTGETRAIKCKGCSRLRVCDLCSGLLLPERGEDARPTGYLRCASCGSVSDLTCPACGFAKVRRLGVGTRGLAREASLLFPGVKIAVVDRDSDIPPDEAGIVVGTEAAFWRLRSADLIVVVDLDSLLLAPDAFASELAFRILARAASLVAPRSGRNVRGGLLIQTHLGKHPVYTSALEGNSEKALEYVLVEREKLGFPPFSRAAKVVASGKDCEKWSREMSQGLGGADVTVLGPIFAENKSQLIVMSQRPVEHWATVAHFSRLARSGGCRVRIEVDPVRLG